MSYSQSVSAFLYHQAVQEINKLKDQIKEYSKQDTTTLQEKLDDVLKENSTLKEELKQLQIMIAETTQPKKRGRPAKAPVSEK